MYTFKIAMRYIPVSYLAEYLYCPRNLYLRVIEGIERKNEDMKIGEYQEERRQKREKVISGSREVFHGVEVASETLGLVARIDAVEKNGNVYPVEFKKGKRRNSLSHRVQLCAQGMLLEEYLGKEIAYGFIFYMASRSRVKVRFDKDLRRKVILTKEEVKKMLEEPVEPPPLKSSRCKGCSLREVCFGSEGVLPLERKGKTIYLTVPGTALKKNGNACVVVKDGEVIAEFPLKDLEGVVLVGRTHITFPLLSVLMERGVNVYFVKRDGSFGGMFIPSERKNVNLRMRQYKMHFDEKQSLKIARKFVKGKIANMKALLMRYNRKGEVLEEFIRDLRLMEKRTESVRSHGELLGVEGYATQRYFEGCEKILDKVGVKFDKRERRPPRNPANSVLSYLYTLLLKDIISALYISGLDPYFGFLHINRPGRPSLALDLMEEFRPVVADALMLYLFRRKILDISGDFKIYFGGCYIKPHARKKIFAVYEEKKRQEVQHPEFKKAIPYYRIFEIQARILGKVVVGLRKEYTPFIIR